MNEDKLYNKYNKYISSYIALKHHNKEYVANLLS